GRREMVVAETGGGQRPEDTVVRAQRNDALRGDALGEHQPRDLRGEALEREVLTGQQQRPARSEDRAARGVLERDDVTRRERDRTAVSAHEVEGFEPKLIDFGMVEGDAGVVVPEEPAEQREDLLQQGVEIQL